MPQKTFRILAVATALGVAAWGLTVFAEGTDDGAKGKPEGSASQDAPPRRPPPRPPLEVVLDQDHDNEISAEELDAATANLKKLDKNGDGKLTPDEYRPPRREGGPRDGTGSREGGPRDGQGPREGRGPRDGDATGKARGPRDRDGAKKGDGACPDKSQGEKQKSEGQSE